MTIESQIDRSDKENSKPSSSSNNKQSQKVTAGLNTKLTNDPRVHCCLYFLSPQNPHRLRAVDVEAMKSLGDKVNLIPVIAKADTLTAEELVEFKAMVLEQLSSHNIKVFQIPELTTLQQQFDPELQQENKKNKVCKVVMCLFCHKTSIGVGLCSGFVPVCYLWQQQPS